jgi:hypothetical protein
MAHPALVLVLTLCKEVLAIQNYQGVEGTTKDRDSDR